jgi:hypothetical protein
VCTNFIKKPTILLLFIMCGGHALKLNKKVAISLLALTSIGCAPNAYVGNTLSKADSAVKTQAQSYGASTRIVADFNGDAILDMLVSTTKGLVARLGKRNDTYRDTLIYRVDENSGIAPGDITTWYNSETEKQTAFFSLPTEVSYWTAEGNKRFSKNKIGTPMNDEDLELSDRVNNTILEEGDNVWGITASKHSISSYAINSRKLSKKREETKKEKNAPAEIISKNYLFPIKKTIAPDITTGDFNGDGLTDIAVLESDSLYFLTRNDDYPDSLAVNYMKGVDLSKLVSKDSIDENSLRVHTIRTKDGSMDNVICGFGDFLLYFKYGEKEKRFICDAAYKMPMQKTSAKLNYNLAVQYNANGNAFVYILPESGKKLKYLIGPDGLIEN